MTTPINLETIVQYTGKLNKAEKAMTKVNLENKKSLGTMLNDIALARGGSTHDWLNQMQDAKNSKIKNPCSSKVPLDLKKDSQTNQLNHWEQRQKVMEQMHEKTDQFINLQKSKKGKPKDLIQFK